jgi:uncharacterized protein with PIN domain
MRFLIDTQVSFALATGLRRIGVDAIHLSELGQGGLSDKKAVQLAADSRRVMITREAETASQCSAVGAIELSWRNGSDPAHVQDLLSSWDEVARRLASGEHHIIIEEDSL